MCIRGSHSASGRPLGGHVPAFVDLALEEECFGAYKPLLAFLFNLNYCPVCALFVLGMVGKGNPPSPGKKVFVNIYLGHCVTNDTFS